ncbi:hypothetical protein E3Q16_04070 [Wallemia mellicola]|uniref:Uncharacterized protein n=1 Tax=Wallemia mellicola TaxID=1708541 RepID=A0A4T0NRT1_9BASI|nr:hypothetical protein E3Q16_04070 [Wallemia mellicola]TIC62247.1 hypothetical protein E3Q01_04045 [Wallemia mellicola]
MSSELFKEKAFGFSFVQDGDVDLVDDSVPIQQEVIPPAIQVDKNQFIPNNRQFHLNIGSSQQQHRDTGPRRLEAISSVEGAYYMLPYLNLSKDDEQTRLREPRGWLEMPVEAPFTANEEPDQAEQRWENLKADLTFNYKRRAREAQKSKRRRNNLTADDGI